jgi:hypothetical protein
MLPELTQRVGLVVAGQPATQLLAERLIPVAVAVVLELLLATVAPVS